MRKVALVVVVVRMKRMVIVSGWKVQLCLVVVVKVSLRSLKMMFSTVLLLMMVVLSTAYLSVMS